LQGTCNVPLRAWACSYGAMFFMAAI